MARKQTYNPNVSALLSKSLGGNSRMQPGDQSGVNPNLAASLMALGYLPKHRNMRGELMMPGQTQGGSGLDGQTFRGLDEGAALQGGDRGQYAQPQFSMIPGGPNWNPAAPMPQGFDPAHPTVVSRGSTIDMPTYPGLQSHRTVMPLGPTGGEDAQMAQDRAAFAQDRLGFRTQMEQESPRTGASGPAQMPPVGQPGPPGLPGPPPRPPGIPLPPSPGVPPPGNLPMPGQPGQLPIDVSGYQDFFNQLNAPPQPAALPPVPIAPPPPANPNVPVGPEIPPAIPKMIPPMGGRPGLPPPVSGMQSPPRGFPSQMSTPFMPAPELDTSMFQGVQSRAPSSAPSYEPPARPNPVAGRPQYIPPSYVPPSMYQAPGPGKIPFQFKPDTVPGPTNSMAPPQTPLFGGVPSQTLVPPPEPPMPPEVPFEYQPPDLWIPPPPTWTPPTIPRPVPQRPPAPRDPNALRGNKQLRQKKPPAGWKGKYPY